VASAVGDAAVDSTGASVLDRQLREVLVAHAIVAADATVTSTIATGGASRQTVIVTATARDDVHRCVVRIDRDGTTLGLSLPTEADLLRLAGRAGVPVPGVLLVGDAGDGLGAPFVVVDHVTGETLPKRIRREPGFAVARDVLATQFGTALGRLHSVPVDQAPEVLSRGVDPVEHWRHELDLTAQPHPAFEIALRWLDANRPEPRAAVIVHGDFRMGNMIIGPEGLRAVLDWELSLVGDPREDLGWLCSPSWRFGGTEPVGGIGSYTALLDAYEAAGGARVDPGELRWFEVLASLRWGVLCIKQTLRHVTGATPSVELATLGRRVCEMEWTLLELIR
jgi:aminoglycoside phosphotransferase (APT) family kinase protein